MKTSLILVPMLVVGLARAQSVTEQMVKWADSGKVSTQKPASNTLTNDSIVKLANAGLGEGTIISMVNTQQGKYSLSPEDVIALKGAGVSENIISAMLKRSASAPSDPPPTEATTSITEVGVYLKKSDAWVQMMPEVVNWKTGGVLKSLGTMGVVKGDVNGRLNGKTSRYSAGTPVEFLIYVPESVEISEYQLVRLREHHDGREFRTVTGGVFHQSGGATRDIMTFDHKKAAMRTYLVTLSDLHAGEYGFLSPGAVLSSHASAQLGKMYTFRVIE